MLFILLLSGGCQYPFEFASEKEIREEVLSQDPSFGGLLKKKATIDEEITSLKSEVSKKANEINAKISTLKRELLLAKEHNTAIAKELDQQLDPFRIELNQKSMELMAELKLKESSLSSTRSMITRLRKMIEQSSSAEEMASEVPKWQDKIKYHSQQADNLQKEVTDLRSEIRLIRLKSKLLK